MTISAARAHLGASRAAALLIAVMGVLGVLSPGLLLPLAVALLLGLPHGAVDHVVAAQRIGGRRGWAVGTIGYGAAALVTLWLAGAAPQIVWPAFLLLSAWHFGTGEADATRQPGRRGFASDDLTHAAGTGSLVVGGLMVAGAEQLRPLAVTVTPRIAFLLDPALVRGVAILTGVLVAAAIAHALVAGRPDRILDLGLLLVLFLAAPPLWAFAAYFGLWHAPRHIARLLADEEPFASTPANRRLRRFARTAAVPTGIAVAAMLGLAAASTQLDTVEVTAVALRVTAAVTFPHALLVTWMDLSGPAGPTDVGRGADDLVDHAHAPRPLQPTGG